MSTADMTPSHTSAVGTILRPLLPGLRDDRSPSGRRESHCSASRTHCPGPSGGLCPCGAVSLLPAAGAATRCRDPGSCQPPGDGAGWAGSHRARWEDAAQALGGRAGDGRTQLQLVSQLPQGSACFQNTQPLRFLEENQQDELRKVEKQELVASLCVKPSTGNVHGGGPRPTLFSLGLSFPIHTSRVLESRSGKAVMRPAGLSRSGGLRAEFSACFNSLPLSPFPLDIWASGREGAPVPALRT